MNEKISIMTSQIGYDLGDPIRAVIRSNRKIAGLSYFLSFEDKKTIEGIPYYWGKKWGDHWSSIDFSQIEGPGNYKLHICKDKEVISTSDTIEIGRNILFEKTFFAISHDFLNIRSDKARTGMGWKDCGSDLQELSSHAMCVDSICDILETLSQSINKEQYQFLLTQLIRGCDYIVHLQNRAKNLGFGDGPVVHEDRDKDIVTGNIVKTATTLARVSRLIHKKDIKKSIDYLNRSKMAFAWIDKNGPVDQNGAQDFFSHVHGAPIGSVPPKGQWMTRDLFSMIEAAIQLSLAGQSGYKEKAIYYANLAISRQVPKNNSEAGFYGHFYTFDNFDSFNGEKFTEKANIHCGAWSEEGRIYNKGGHQPHWILPLIQMLKLWPDYPGSSLLRECLFNFTYGYLIPVCSKSPFDILPAGYFTNQGLLFFGNWYHAHNNIYAFIASLAIEINQIIDEPKLRKIAVANIQWICGLNCGIVEEGSENYLPISMVHGIGNRYRGSWSKIIGSICNGFSSSPQFKIIPSDAKSDRPVYLDDEAYIAHSLPFLAALSRLKAYR